MNEEVYHAFLNEWDDVALLATQKEDSRSCPAGVAQWSSRPPPEQKIPGSRFESRQGGRLLGL
jgi:hypothetical protein